MPILVLENIGKTYPSGPNGTVEILKGVNLVMEPSQTCAIVGPSGSGKSTLLNIVGTLDFSTTGRVLMDGQDVSMFDNADKAVFRNRRIGFVFQLHHLLPQCSVLENVLIPAIVNKDTGDAEKRADALLETVGLGDRRNHRPGQLSGGERQRVAVVRAMINNPKILLADEPTGSLDNSGAEKLGDLMVKLNKQFGMTLLVVTHSESLAERMDMIYELSSASLTRKK
ncbi:MAG: hypothetical protein A2283_15465 [Lentisphaerae bacterium RIFOXYA12_FULL_48_11]|nr:MAG: hypothetical protein A2283_15465 [Lentisphaerae bacterium RIFOXYA12_FULL_48_11]